MNFLQKTFAGLLIAAAGAGLTSCNQPNDSSRPTYTAARHMNTGSHVPQSSDINNASSVYTPTPGQESIGGTATLPHDSGH